MSDLGKKIRALRVAQGATLPEVAERAQISKGLLSTIENNSKSNPSISTLRKISLGLGTSLNRLIGEEENLRSGLTSSGPVWQKELTSFIKSQGSEPDPGILEAMAVLQNAKSLDTANLEYWKFLYKSIENGTKG